MYSCPECDALVELKTINSNHVRITCEACSRLQTFGPLDKITGHRHVKSILKRWGEDFLRNNRAIPHVIFLGPAGTGKVTAAKALADHFLLRIKEIEGRDLCSCNSLLPAIVNASDRNVILIKRIDYVKADVLAELALMLERKTCELSLEDDEDIWLDEEEEESVYIRIHLRPFTIIGTAESLVRIPPSLLSVFNKCEFRQLSLDELTQVVYSVAFNAFGVVIDQDAARSIALHSNDSAEQARALVSYAISYASKGKLCINGVMKALQDKGFATPSLPAGPHVDAHPNGSRSLSQLLKFAPEEFESLVGRLMIAMGMKSKVTKVSGDGGVDVVSESAEPIRGGCFFIQCKRFGPRNLVGVEAVRELMGVVHRERATKGVLITTSDFTGGARREAREFGNQIELINGEKLITLLSQYKV